MKVAAIAVFLAGCAEGVATTGSSVGEVGPPASGWTTSATQPSCAPEDVAARLHFAKVSQLSWRTPTERVALARADVGDTRQGDTQTLDRVALDAAMRRIAPIALEATGERAAAMELRAAAPLLTASDLEAAIAVVASARAELPRGSPAEPVLASLENGLRDAQAEGFPEVRCAELVGHGTVESQVAAAAIRAGAPRARIAAEGIDLLHRMAATARAEAPA